MKPIFLTLSLIFLSPMLAASQAGERAELTGAAAKTEDDGFHFIKGDDWATGSDIVLEIGRAHV